MYAIEQISSKVTVTVVDNNDSDFFNKIKLVLAEGSTIQSPVSIERWTHNEQKSFLNFSGIIIITESAVLKHDTETLAVAIGNTIFDLTENKANPLTTLELLLCKKTDSHVISTFCEMYKLQINEYMRTEVEVFSWSTLYSNNLRNLKFKPSRPIYQH